MAFHEYRESSFGPAADPLRLALRLARSGLFDDYVVYENNGAWTYAGGALSSVSLDAREVRTVVDGTETRTPWTGSPGNALRVALAAAPVVGWNAFGWLSFEFATLLPAIASVGVAVPAGELARLIVPRAEVRITRDGVVSRSVDADVNDRVREVLAASEERAVPLPTAVDIRADDSGYRERVAQGVREIRDERYQKVILSRRVDIPFTPDFHATYELGRRANTPARSFLLDLNGFRAAGFSPEVVATVDLGGQVTTQPLAGTRAFGRGAGVDAAARRDLESDPKEVFEHAISVRAVQEELVGVCRPGTVGIRDFMNVKERGSVQHLASLVGGTLTDSHTAWDALEAVFPAVTASGIPKRESLDAIVRLDAPRRGLYAGAVLTVSHDGALDAALVLRAVYEQDGRAWLRAGAGIVADSTSEREFEESCEKLTSVAPFVVRKSPTPSLPTP